MASYITISSLITIVLFTSYCLSNEDNELKKRILNDIPSVYFYNRVKRHNPQPHRPQVSSGDFNTGSASLQQSLQNLQQTQQQSSQRPNQQFNQFGGSASPAAGLFGNQPSQNEFSNWPNTPQNNAFNSGQPQNGGFQSQTSFGQGNGDSSPPAQGELNGFNTNQFGNTQQFESNQPQNSQQAGAELPSWNLPGSQQQNSQQTQASQGTQTTQRNPLNVAANENTISEAACVRRCQTTSQYNPVCGTDNVSYSNVARLRCAQQCGRQVGFVYNGVCVTTRAPST